MLRWGACEGIPGAAEITIEVCHAHHARFSVAAGLPVRCRMLESGRIAEQGRYRVDPRRRAGGIVGNQFGKGKGNVLATVAGAVVGGLVGSEIGKSMDARDRQLAQEAELDALERGSSGQPRKWKNPDNGRYGEVVPSKPYKKGPSDCRDYTHTIYIDGRPQQMRGTACRNPDGTWANVG